MYTFFVTLVYSLSKRRRVRDSRPQGAQPV